MYSALLLKFKRSKNVKGKTRATAEPKMEEVRERRTFFSLEIHKIRPLDFDGASRENVLRGAGDVWTPELRVLTNSKR